jgi:hypothetical protein
VLAFCGAIYLAPGTRTNAIINRYGNFQILNVIALQPAWHPQPYIPECAPAPAPVYGMIEADFNRLKNSIYNLGFESSKMQVVKQALKYNHVTTFQVAELSRMMTFESTKLELAKLAYHKTIDKQNYYIINDTFTFESSIEELNDYINQS